MYIEAPVKIHHESDYQGILFWFEIDVGGGHKLNTFEDESHWDCTAVYFDEPLQLKRGEAMFFLSLQTMLHDRSVHVEAAVEMNSMRRAKQWVCR